MIKRIVQDMPLEAYLKEPGLSSTDLRKIRKNAEQWKYEQDNPPEETEPMFQGTAIHCAVLEPKRFRNVYVETPKFDRRTKQGKADAEQWQADNEGMIGLNPDEWRMCLKIIEQTQRNETVAKLLNGKHEVSIFWEDVPSGILLKARLDCLGNGWVVDLKSTKDASYDPFSRSIGTYKYHMQAAHYLEGGSKALKETLSRFVFIAVERTPPYSIACYQLDLDAINKGRAENREALDKYIGCMQTNKWPGYGEGVTMISVPPWA
jgi:hypothetical protein